MTPKERAAMQQALEALEVSFDHLFMSGHGRSIEKAITALREAVAGDNMTPTEQAEQEPVATDMERADAYLKGYTDARRDSKDKSK